MDSSRKKPNRREGGWGHTNFWKKTPGISSFLTSPLEIADKTKQASPLEILQNGVRSLRNLKAKNQDSWEFYMIFLEFVRRYIESQLFLS